MPPPYPCLNYPPGQSIKVKATKVTNSEVTWMGLLKKTYQLWKWAQCVSNLNDKVKVTERLTDTDTDKKKKVYPNDLTGGRHQSFELTKKEAVFILKCLSLRPVGDHKKTWQIYMNPCFF